MGKIKTEKKTFYHANNLLVEAGTNTPMGGDAGHGGITLFRVKDEAGTAWTLKFKDSKGKEHEIEQPQELTIELYGDTEAITFTDALLFALHALKMQNIENSHEKA